MEELYSSATKKYLLSICKEKHIKGYSNKSKGEIVERLLQEKNQVSLNHFDEENIVVSEQEKDYSFKFIDLFCGIGGFHQALDKLGGKCVFASDSNKECRETYEKNYGLKPHGDITKVNVNSIPDFDILTGGFPCQSFSHSGKKGGFEDKRGQLYENILDIAQEKQPSFMFLEKWVGQGASPWATTKHH